MHANMVWTIGSVQGSKGFVVFCQCRIEMFLCSSLELFALVLVLSVLADFTVHFINKNLVFMVHE